MCRNKADEYGFDPRMETTYINRDEYSYAEEYKSAAKEDALPKELKDPAPEFNGTVFAAADENKSENRRKKIKRIMFTLTAAVAASLSIVFAANSLDPLGADFLMTGSLTPSSPTTPVTPVTPTTPTTPTTPATPTTPTTPTVYTDSFPSLPNQAPDFAGNYAWSGLGTEEYVLVGTDYLHAGTVYTDSGTPIATVSGASYDKNTNTLTLNNYTGTVINVNLMGNGFKIELIGENSIDYLIAWGAMYGGSVTFTGNGSIRINENLNYDTGIMLECEDSPSCIMVDREATVEVFGKQAIVIHRTTLNEAIYALQPVKVSGGTYSTGEFVEYSVNVTDENGVPLKDENGEYITEIKTVKDIAQAQGTDLYDYSVVGEDGKSSSHVIFKPE